jgi:YggT family protein
MLSTALGFLIDVVFGLFTYALLLRLVMQVMRAPFRNPLGQSVMALTDWVVKPLRRVMPGVGGIDWASSTAYVFQFAWLLRSTSGRGFALLGPGLAFVAVAALIAIARRCCG